jgi:hypothetical protein
MQDRYAGDVGDFLSFGLLRHLCESSRSNGRALRIAINWYLTPDEAHNGDGRHIGYLSAGNPWHTALNTCDPELMRCLRQVVAGGRSVSALEASGAVPAANLVHRERLLSTFMTEERRLWHARALERLAGADVVFADPDNGIRASGSGANALKYALVEELADYARRGQSLIAYQHAGRSADAATQARERLRYLAAQVDQKPVGAIICRRGSCRFFLVTAAEDRSDPLAHALESFATRWTPHASLVAG